MLMVCIADITNSFGQEDYTQNKVMMTNGWQTVQLRQVIKLDLTKVPIDADAEYPMVGVYSFGRGLFLREPVSGNKTSYKFFYELKAEHIVMSQLFGWEGALALSSDKFEGLFVSPQFPTFLCDPDQLDRSEEHTSELQSRPHLVCRLLLEKKKKKRRKFVYKKTKNYKLPYDIS